LRRLSFQKIPRVRAGLTPYRSFLSLKPKTQRPKDLNDKLQNYNKSSALITILRSYFQFSRLQDYKLTSSDFKPTSSDYKLPSFDYIMHKASINYLKV
jgi:hypothetical protein